MIPIHIPTYHYTAKVGAQVARTVTCEECGLEYVYVMTRSAEGEGSSVLFLDMAGAQSSAEQKANELLRHKLQTSCDPVPCPSCGRYQEHMIPRARWHRNRWMLKTGLALFPLSVIAMLVALVVTALAADKRDVGLTILAGLLWACVAVGGVGAVALPLYKYLSSRNYDPNNEDLEDRKKRGQERAISKQEFARRIGESGE
jgi:hypothetical protein